MVGRPILLVEDDEDIVAALQMVLEDEGFEALHAPDVPQAIASIEKNKPGLVLLDWTLESRSGKDVLDAAKKSPATASIPFVLLTGQSRLSPEESDGAEAVLQKPFEIDELIEVVKKFYKP